MGWAEIQHPFHPLRGQSFPVLKKRRVSGLDTLILQGLQHGTFCVAREWDRWVVLYIERWLKAPVQEEDGGLIPREKGTPQGGVVSPLLANLFLHYGLDRWLATNYPQVRFERYADDVIVHCRTERQAQEVRKAIAERLQSCGLELHGSGRQGCESRKVKDLLPSIA